MAQLFADAARAYLSAGIAAGDTNISITAGGNLFPVATGADWFKAVLQDASGIEIVYVTAHTSGASSFTVTRGQEGTTARSFAAGAVFGIRATAADMVGFAAKLADAPSDGKTYGRKNAAWAAAEPSIATSVAANYWSGDKSWRDFFASVRSATLTGLSTATNAAATATDTVLSAIGKLQAQINNRQETLVSGTNIKTLNGSSLLGAGDVVISGGVSADTGFDTVGSFCVARVALGNSAITVGSTVAGSSLRPGSFNGSSVYDNSGMGGQTLSGTWRALGQTPSSPTGFFLLFQRIA